MCCLFVMIFQWIETGLSQVLYISKVLEVQGKMLLIQIAFSCFRFEPDMLAFSGCDYGGGEKERIELGEIRKRWKTLHVRLHLFLEKVIQPL